MALASSARAQEAPPPEVAEESIEEAREEFARGSAAFEAADFAAALAHFERSHALSGRPLLLFNMASAAERLRRDRDAIQSYERYLREVPDATNRPYVEGRIRILRAALEPTEEAPVDPVPARGSVLDEWWLWTMIGVVVVGAGVGIGVGVALENPPREPLLRGNFGADGIATALVRF